MIRYRATITGKLGLIYNHHSAYTATGENGDNAVLVGSVTIDVGFNIAAHVLSGYLRREH